MKIILTKVAVALAVISLVGCSTNTQKENAGVGTVTGAVAGGLAGSLIGGGTGQIVAIGLGAVAGALVGGYVGHNMDSSDNVKMNSAMNNPTNQPTTWKNSKTGATYTVVPTSKPMKYKGMKDCRQFNTTAIINGKSQQVSGVACLKSDGTWHAVKS